MSSLTHIRNLNHNHYSRRSPSRLHCHKDRTDQEKDWPAVADSFYTGYQWENSTNPALTRLPLKLQKRFLLRQKPVYIFFTGGSSPAIEAW